MRLLRRYFSIAVLLLAGLGGIPGCSGKGDPVGPAPAANPAGQREAAASGNRRSSSETDGASPAEESVAQAAAKRVKEERPQRVVRPTLEVPRYDEARLRELGIDRYASKRLVLYTDVAPEFARQLPPLMDQAFAAWEEYFGPLPPDSAGTEFQMIGHIMVDRARFREAGILTDDIRIHLEGVFRKQVFWMNDQPEDYVRRHLMIHEGTHCFMIAFPNSTNRHIWYMEGMADLFRTHATDAAGVSRFRVFPTDRQNFPGLGRTRVIEEEVRTKGPRRVEDVAQLSQRDFLNYDAYSWSWALCAFLDGHPKYRERFRQIGQVVVGRNDVPLDLRQIFQADWAELSEEWLVFAGNVCYGYDIERTTIDLRPGQSLATGAAMPLLDVAANRGWQTSGVLVEAGKTYRIAASGQCVLATQPKPWVSEPPGVSIRYCGGHRLGQLLATVRSQAPVPAAPYTTMLQVAEVGSDLEFSPSVTGTLYFRVNDVWGELGDNTGTYRVSISVIR